MSESNEKATPKGGRKMKLLPVLLLVFGLVGGFGVTKVMGASSPTSAATTTPAAVDPGEIAPITALNVNLVGGHYLRIALGVQLDKETKAEEWLKTNGSKVRDVVIDRFSGRSMEELSTTQGRKAAVENVTEEIKRRSEGKVLTVYLDEFVMH